MPVEGVFEMPQNINRTRMRWVEMLLKRDLSHLYCKKRGAGTPWAWELKAGVELEPGKLLSILSFIMNGLAL